MVPAKIENYCSTDIFHAQKASQKHYIPFIRKTSGDFFSEFFCSILRNKYILWNIYIFLYFVCVCIYICLNHCLIPYALNVFIKLITVDWRLMDIHRKFSYSNKDLLCWNHSCFPYNFSTYDRKACISLYFFRTSPSSFKYSTIVYPLPCYFA